MEEMAARRFANFPARVDLVEANGARTEAAFFHGSKFVELHQRATLQRPSFRKSRASWHGEELDHAVQFLAEGNQAPIEDVDLHCVGEER